MKRVHTLLFGAGIVAALGFGSASAFAAPAAERNWFTCPYKPVNEAGCANCCLNFEMSEYVYNPFSLECRCWAG